MTEVGYTFTLTDEGGDEITLYFKDVDHAEKVCNFFRNWRDCDQWFETREEELMSDYYYMYFGSRTSYIMHYYYDKEEEATIKWEKPMEKVFPEFL